MLPLSQSLEQNFATSLDKKMYMERELLGQSPVVEIFPSVHMQIHEMQFEQMQIL